MFAARAAGFVGSRTAVTRPIMVVVLGMAVAGALAGVLWAWLAPPVHGAVALTRRGERVHAYLGNEGDHFFVAAVLMVGLLITVGVVAAVWVWQWRQRRGPEMVIALTLGGLVAGGVATAVGAGLARLRYGGVDVAAAPVAPEDRVHYVTEAPAVFFGHGPAQMLITLLLPSMLAALAYALAAAASPSDDLDVESPLGEITGYRPRG